MTSALLVRVPSAPGVATMATVAEPPPAIVPRLQLAPNASTVQEPWLGVAESTAAVIVRPSETTTPEAGPAPRLVTVRV